MNNECHSTLNVAFTHVKFYTSNLYTHGCGQNSQIFSNKLISLLINQTSPAKFFTLKVFQYLNIGNKPSASIIILLMRETVTN